MYFNKTIASRKGGNTSIAYWNFSDNMNKTNTTISLADTITKSDCKIAQNCIAPGTEGNFKIIVNVENSNVKIDYIINLIKEENTPSNLYFFIKDSNNDKKFSNLKQLFEEIDFSGSFDINDEKSKIYEIYWKWPFENYKEDGSIDEAKDIEDLNFARNQKDYVFEIEISGKQSIK